MFEENQPVVDQGQIVNQNRSSLTPKSGSKKNLPIVILAILVVALGIGTGYLVSGKSGFIRQSATIQSAVVTSGDISVGVEYGDKDNKTFTDQAIGVVETGGIDGEGTHKLIREGGPSQTVYMTSSTLDLDKFTGRKVQVWGETFKAQKAGWLMDVGRLKVLE